MMGKSGEQWAEKPKATVNLVGGVNQVYLV